MLSALQGTAERGRRHQRRLKRLKARRRKRRRKKDLVGGQQDPISRRCPGWVQSHEPLSPRPAERGNVLQRALNTLRFLWVLCQAMVDGLTQWLDACTQEHTDMSTVLQLERYVLTQRLAKVTHGEGGWWRLGPQHCDGADPMCAVG